MPNVPNTLRRQTRRLALLAATALVPVGTGQAQDSGPSYGTYGTPGLIDMPTAQADRDATLAATLSRVGDTTRSTLTFQITPRLSGSFRYTGVANYTTPGSSRDTYYDRSFDLRYQLVTEGALRPAVAIGLQDFIGTGLYGGEYVVATKTLAPGLSVTGGIGWGRLGSHGSFANTGARPVDLLGTGGVPAYDRWFRGDVAAFGGLAYSPNERLTFKVEYSSDSYEEEWLNGDFDRKSSWNFGLDYRLRNGTQLSFYHAYGTQIGAQVTFFANPRNSGVPGGNEGAPVPVTVRAPGAAADLGWTTNTNASAAARRNLEQTLALDELQLEGMDLTARTATVRLVNDRFGSPAQAIGRTARAMSRTLPASVETFVIVPVVNGIPMSAVTLARTDIERLEHSDSAEMLARAGITDAFGRAPEAFEGSYPKFDWALRPNLSFSFFDPDQPVRADLRARLSASYRIAPNLVLDGAVSKRLAGNIADSRAPNGAGTTLYRVRTNAARYAQEGDFALDRLALTHYGRPGRDLYSRVTAGYLEQMYAGLSTELLWKPVDSRLALGAEVNYVRQREFDQRFGLQDYDIVMGHASAYYDFGNGFHGQLDVGRYLAGDYGATVSVDREFANGWRLGAYATFTDASAEDFGEGSFDKGLRLTIPLSWASGQPSRAGASMTIRSLTRDGGAQLNVGQRLYGQVREYHDPELAKSWGKFWR